MFCVGVAEVEGFNRPGTQFKYCPFCGSKLTKYVLSFKYINTPYHNEYNDHNEDSIIRVKGKNCGISVYADGYAYVDLHQYAQFVKSNEQYKTLCSILLSNAQDNEITEEFVGGLCDIVDSYILVSLEAERNTVPER